MTMYDKLCNILEEAKDHQDLVRRLKLKKIEFYDNSQKFYKTGQLVDRKREYSILVPAGENKTYMLYTNAWRVSDIKGWNTSIDKMLEVE